MPSRTVTSIAQLTDTEERTREDFPEPCNRRIKRGDSQRLFDSNDIQQERNRDDGAQKQFEVPPASPGNHSDNRPQQIKLLLDAQGPEMKQRFVRTIEVSSFVP